jgi:hypothetical protein
VKARARHQQTFPDGAGFPPAFFTPFGDPMTGILTGFDRLRLRGSLSRRCQPTVREACRSTGRNRLAVGIGAQRGRNFGVSGHVFSSTVGHEWTRIKIKTQLAGYVLSQFHTEQSIQL